MPQLKMQLPQVPDVPWQDTQFTFNGQWMPDLDPALIGPENYATLQNLRYKDKGLEGISGYAYINNDTAISTYVNVRNGMQLRSPFNTKSYNVVHAADDSNPSRVYFNTTAIGSEGDFVTGENFDPTGKPSSKLPYIIDSEAGLTGRFATGPQGTLIYCNSKQSKVFSGYETRIAAAFACLDQSGTAVVDVTDKLTNSITDRVVKLQANLVAAGDFEHDVGTSWNNVGTPTVSGTSTAHLRPGSTHSYKFTADAADDGIKSDPFTVEDATTYRWSAWVYSTTDTSVYMKIYDGDGASLDDTEYTIIQNQWNHITIEKATGASGGGSSAAIEFRGPEAGSWWIDDVVVTRADSYPELQIMTTRPVQGFYFYIQSGGENSTASTLDAEYWSGAGYTDVADDDDDTAITGGTITLGQSGFYRFAHTGGNADGGATAGTDSTLSAYAEFRHFQELYLYSYRIKLSAGLASIYQITADTGFQPIQNVWDGIYRQPIQWQFWNNSTGGWEDYTLYVNQSSDVNSPVGAQLDAMDENDYVIMMFEDQMSAINFTMLGNLLNSNASVITLYYWNGYEWTAITAADHYFQDGTLNDLETKSFTRSGLLSWTPQIDEQKQTLFNTLGYAYKLVVSDALSGAEGGDAEVVIDLCTGIPALINEDGRHEIESFDFATNYRNRVMLGSFSQGGEQNRMDFSAENAPDVWNGDDSSNGGVYSLYFGGESKITNATQLYNRFGSNIFAMLLVLKESATYILTGNTPESFEIFPVSLNIGCPAPLTLATAEMGFEAGEGLQRQVAIWVSHSGPVMFDGAVLMPIKGIDLYFDPSEDEFVNWSYMHLARGWVDNVYKEYNLLLPSTDGQATLNVWLVYDLIHKKWFKKDVGTAYIPQSGWSAIATTGEQGVIAGIGTGQIVELETGTSWGCTYDDLDSGAGIQQKVRTGDFFPSNNIWDNCLLRKFKLICEKIASAVTITLGINYYENAANSASNVVFQDADPNIGVNVDFTDMDVDADGVSETIWASSAEAVLTLNADVGTDRLVRLIQDLNQLGWSHSFEFEVTTTDVEKGFKPIAWGVRYRVERKDDTATG